MVMLLRLMCLVGSVVILGNYGFRLGAGRNTDPNSIMRMWEPMFWLVLIADALICVFYGCIFSDIPRQLSAEPCDMYIGFTISPIGVASFLLGLILGRSRKQPSP